MEEIESDVKDPLPALPLGHLTLAPGTTLPSSGPCIFQMKALKLVQALLGKSI